MDFVSKQQNICREKINYEQFSLDEQQRLVGAFVWLVKQDKKQNPELYQTNKTKNYDRYGLPTDTKKRNNVR